MLCRELVLEVIEHSDIMWIGFVFTLQIRRQAQRDTVIFPSCTANQSGSQKLCFLLIQQNSYRIEHRVVAKFANSLFLSLGEIDSVIHVCQR